ncbi:hypothetical protein BV898_05855 [Hypsibius exemplaris]|uniref:Cytokine receptor n=1 Tax=Hypsibius exemplaris TaxID=2072580 RepID=A0A1W0WXX5_HYPEX|nr:hypothetical protein BV898_05855 [Hypsibius exemplaris]
MARIALRWRFSFCLVALCLLRPSQNCYTFLDQNIGYLQPEEFLYVEEGTTLRLNCTIDSVYAANHSLTSADIYWENPTYERMSEEVDKRINLSIISNYTAALDIANVTVLDDGHYKCAVMVDGLHTRICHIEVPIAGPPKKYLDFSCESSNFLNLICSWKKSGYYTGRSQMKYTLKYRTEAGPDEYDCPRLISSRDGWYRCEWNATIMKHPPMMLHYTHFLTINGTNSFGSDTWTEVVTPRSVVRPDAPVNLTVATATYDSCSIKWSIVDNLSGTFQTQTGLITEIEIAKQSVSGTLSPWTVIADDVRVLQYDIPKLDAYANYSIRVRTRPQQSGFWSAYSTVSCTTKPTRPTGKLGIVPGAYEEVGSGGQRRITLYWQGIPEHLRNGPDFRYRVVSRVGGESHDLGETVFANYFIALPANSSLLVDVIPVNEKGEGVEEHVEIPAVRDHPLLIERAHVVRFKSDSRYEVSWRANLPADSFDIFWCATSLQPHLAKCTDRMDHVNVPGNLNAYNLTLSSENEYRFAVAGRAGYFSLSGMNWIARQCSSSDEHARLEGLTAMAFGNGTVDVSWNTPCQHRFLHISGYRLYYYRCEVSAPKECSPDNYIDVTNGTRALVPDLLPLRRYCFLLMVLDDVNSTSPYVHKVEQCIRTALRVSPMPLSAILGGSIAASIVLVMVAFLISRLVKRARNSFKEIKLQSRAINIPPAMFDSKYDDGGYEVGVGGGDSQEQTHYTKVDGDGKSFTRQHSQVSSSGHGSITSDGTSPSSFRVSGSEDMDSDAAFPTKRLAIISGLSGTRLAVSPINGGRTQHRHSSFDLDRLPFSLHQNKPRPASPADPDTVSLGSGKSSLTGFPLTRSAKHRPRKCGPTHYHGAMHITTPSLKTSQLLNSTGGAGRTADSGVSDADSQASSGYVTAAATAPQTSNPAPLTAKESVDTGYVSQESTMSHSLGGSETSVFSELDSPVGRQEPALLSSGYSQLTSSGPPNVRDSAFKLDFGSNSNLRADTTALEVRNPPVAVGSGYVAWPTAS